MTTGELTELEPASDGPTALFLDTSTLFAYFHPDVAEHERVRQFFKRVGNNEIPYRPLFTSTYVVDELTTLLLSKGSHEHARTALSRTLDSDSIEVIRETEEAFTTTRERIERYEDHEISFTDHMSATQMRARDVTHVLAFDGDFETLGFDQIPR